MGVLLIGLGCMWAPMGLPRGIWARCCMWDIWDRWDRCGEGEGEPCMG